MRKLTLKNYNVYQVALQKKPHFCSECEEEERFLKDGRSSIVGHHIDYNKPLEVTCRDHVWMGTNNSRGQGPGHVRGPSGRGR
jgi:hypothetical protein